ncbi:ABC-2 type transport system ATP-binding protein [Salsuginibacillus halophilus]|uniref:ABC-2 type transport system ATP-binding protein n=1 Tax=Salsuginibacillus halophilus TaxID=517424 RepID=A0A2P8HG46_9BACI|nr:ABC transporter ATP-binding protein [Salsuginibacillus halophilus]PSL45170.1 ABC-2 type transport system ATP-binding protein [Salsuginibacillus halophilus]
MALTLNEVTKSFGGTEAVRGLSLSIPEGEMFGMLGANGAGKTTTFRMIIGLLDPNSGSIEWNNQPLTYKESGKVGYLPEERGLYPKLKVADQLIYLGKLRGMKKKDIVPKMRYWLERFQAEAYEQQKVEELSKGNQQKIQLIAAILHEPELLILDEPFSGLDPLNVEILKKAVVELKENGTTIIFSSHRMEHVEEMCEHLCILHKGEPVVGGHIREIKQNFGRKYLVIEAEFDCSFIKTMDGVLAVEERANGLRLEIRDEETAEHIFEALQGCGRVRRFSLEDPSLNDIFIAKVGASYA